jgi:uncharacterized protein YifE (UPF0438 family)
MIADIRPGSKKFYAEEHFFGGIDRSGFFTISEANYLIHYGHTLKGLYDGSLMPETETEHKFVAALSSQEPVMLYEHKLWQKFLYAVYRASHRSSAVSNSKGSMNPSDYYNEMFHDAY